MPTTPLGFTYPALTDAPNGPVQIQQGLTDVDSYLSGFGTVTWTTLTLASGYVSGGVTPQVCRIGRGVSFQGLISPTSGNFTASSTLTLIAAAGIPAGYRPSQTRNMLASSSSAATAVRLIILATGQLQIVTGATTGPYIDLAGIESYPAEL